MFRVGQNHIYTVYIRCIYGIFGREITIHTVIYGAYIRFWPTLAMLDALGIKPWPGAWKCINSLNVVY
jgi:hypothetical protein